jgi:hypothetical protein
MNGGNDERSKQETVFRKRCDYEWMNGWLLNDDGVVLCWMSRMKEKALKKWGR